MGFARQASGEHMTPAAVWEAVSPPSSPAHDSFPAP